MNALMKGKESSYDSRYESDKPQRLRVQTRPSVGRVIKLRLGRRHNEVHQCLILLVGVVPRFSYLCHSRVLT